MSLKFANLIAYEIAPLVFIIFVNLTQGMVNKWGKLGNWGYFSEKLIPLWMSHSHTQSNLDT